MAELVQVGGHRTGMAATLRPDRWWVSPVAVLLGLSAFVIYTTWAAFQGAHYWAGPYLSPLYSPVIFTFTGAEGAAPVEHAWFGTWPEWWPSFLPASPAFLILIFPGIFRFTCYYYRKAYYRAFTWTPPACAVGTLPRKDYRGESYWLLFQNLHRFGLYPSLLLVLILFYDAFLAFFHQGEFGIGVGTVVLLLNACLLGGYTLGCHSLRHIVGGRLDCFSCSMSATTRHKGWKGITKLNEKHHLWAWFSLFWVGFADFYVWMVASGRITDVRIF